MSRNAEVATLFEEFADRLDALDVEYKPRAYRRAAENILDHPVAIEELAVDDPEALSAIEGVGDAIAEKIVEYVETGEIEELEELREELPVQMDELTAVEGVGPKTVGALYAALGITNLDELEAAAEAGEIRSVSGFGAKTEANILENVPFAREASERDLLGHALPVAEDVLTHLDDVDAVVESSAAGSIRRWRPTIGDVDVLIASARPDEAVDGFRRWDRIDRVIEAGEQKVSVRARGTQVDLRVVAPDEFGSALQYFTGNRDHNVRLRNRAIERDLKMNEYGVFDVSGLDEDARNADTRAGNRIAGETEESMYEILDLPWMPPELREDTGEVAAALEGSLPTLVEEDDIRGDLHVHTDWSDGNASIEAMIAAAESTRYDYLGICDHAVGPGMVGGVGLTDEALETQAAEIAAAGDDADIRVFVGVEANIDVEGAVGVDPDILSSLDLVVASPHSALDQDADAATERLVTAVSNPDVDVLGHPTGRLLNRRRGIEPRIEAVAAAAADHDTALEVNANPRRLDLDGMMVRAAIKHGARISINTDAHSEGEFSHMRYGVHTARRGWAEVADVINAWDVSTLESWLDA